ncbi:MAG: CHAT domain-containing tetratricopeptide repeat protein [Acidobacteriota bacterium]
MMWHVYLKYGFCSALASTLLLINCRGAGATPTPRSPVPAEAEELLEGQASRREIAGGQAHTYLVRVKDNDYLSAICSQEGIDVFLEAQAPGMAEPLRIDSIEVAKGRERIDLLAATAGTARITVHPFDEAAARGAYVLEIQTIRPATARDRQIASAARLLGEGRRSKALGDAEALQTAIAKFEESLAIWQQTKDRAAQADTLIELATVLDEVGETTAAREKLARALEIFTALDDDHGEARARFLRGTIADDLGDPRSALEDLLPTLASFTRLGDRRGEAHALNSIGSAHDKKGKRQLGLEYYRRSLAICREIGDRACQAVLLNNIGRLHSQQGRPEEALRHYEQSTNLWGSLGDLRMQAWGLTNVGAVRESLGEPTAAIELYDQALVLRRNVGDRRGEAFTLHNMAAAYAVVGEPQKALELYRAAIKLWQRVGDLRGESATTTNLGALHAQLGNPEKALELLLTALPMTEAAQSPSRTAAALNHIGQQYATMGKPAAALEHYERSLALYRKLTSPRKEARLLANIGSLHLTNKHAKDALPNLEQALDLLRRTGDRRAQGHTLASLGRAHAALGNAHQAGLHFHEAMTLQEAVGDRLGKAETLFHLARFERSQGRPGEAVQRLEPAIETVESVRHRVLSFKQRASLLTAKHSYYELYVDLLMEFGRQERGSGYQEKALRASERSRARSLMDSLVAGRAQIRRGVDPKLLAQERHLQRRIAEQDFARTQQLERDPSSPKAVAAARLLDDLLSQLDELQATIRSESPAYAALTQPQAMRLSEMREQILDQDTVLLEYALGAERSYLWAISPDRFESHELPPREEIDALAKELYEAIVASRETLGRRAFERTAARLSEIILKPVVERLGPRRIVVVPDGALHYLPFGVLPAPGGGPYEPLLARHEIVALPSVSTLGILRRELSGRQPSDGALAILADPVFEADDPRIRQARADTRLAEDQGKDLSLPTRLSRSMLDFGKPRLLRLPYSRLEAQSIADQAAGGKVLEALSFDASRELALSGDLGRFRVLHFATHGLLNARHPELSGLVLSLYDEEGDEQNGFLRAHEIYNLDLPADLVVLSACQTALGPEIRGEGLIGLTRGFMYAGAAGVVASLWRVDDRATAELMARFYREMIREKRLPAAALQQAQLSMWREPAWRAPYYWAGFLFQGDWQAAPNPR